MIIIIIIFCPLCQFPSSLLHLLESISDTRGHAIVGIHAERTAVPGWRFVCMQISLICMLSEAFDAYMGNPNVSGSWQGREYMQLRIVLWSPSAL